MLKNIKLSFQNTEKNIDSLTIEDRGTRDETNLTEHWRNVKETANITKKICFVFVFLMLGVGFYYSLLVEIDDIFVE